MPKPSLALPTLGGAQLWADRRWRDGYRVQQHVLTRHHRLLDPHDRRLLSGTFEACLAALAETDAKPCPEDVVVLLHGLGRSRRSLAGVDRAFRAAGLYPVRVDYPSTRRPLEAHVAQIVELLAHLEGARRVSFFTHSLGGIVARGVLADGTWPSHLAPHRVVMSAPPNGGASFARVLRAHAGALLAAVMGPSALQVGPGPDYPPPPVPFLVIAGHAGRDERGLNPLLDGDDDGIVTVAETALEGMEGQVIVESFHTFVMDHPDARAAAIAFLKR
ncbi:MAG: hypothetical protein KF901_25920 [Myxococcales bacterium]|nr:hypothetical protein [Myxococcales bacterium]